MVYYRFENFEGTDNMNFIDYINKLERVNNQVKHFETELTAGMLAYKVLKNGNISNEKQH